MSIPRKKEEDNSFKEPSNEASLEASTPISREISKGNSTTNLKTDEDIKESDFNSQSSQVRELDTNTIKKYNEEKKEWMHQINKLKKENNELKKKYDEIDQINNEWMGEIDESQQKSEEFLKLKNQFDASSKKAANDLKEMQWKNEQWTQKIATLEEDLEWINEEISTKEWETQVIQKKFDDYKQQTQQQIQNLKAGNTENKGWTVPKEVKENVMSPEDHGNKIREWEEVIAEWSSQLQSTTEQRDYAVTYYQEQIEKWNFQISDLNNKAKIIPEKDDWIRQLTEKLKDEEAIIESLKSQINALSPANDMYEQIIIEKDELESQFEELKAENEKLKEDLQNDEEMVNDLDSALKISEQMVKQSQEETLKARNKEKSLTAKIAELEDNEKSWIAKWNELKKINNIIKDEVSKSKTSLNIDDVLNKNLTTTSKIKTLQRQQVLIQWNEIELHKSNIRNKIINSMIPDKMFQKGNMEVFEKYLNIQSIRMTTLELIFNILENDIINDDLDTIKENEEKMDSIEGENLKRLISFYKFVLQVLFDYNSILYKMEIYLSKLSNEEFINITTDETFTSIYINISAGKQMIDTLIKWIQEDSFSIQYQSNADGLKNINSKIDSLIIGLNIPEDAWYTYMANWLGYYLNLTIMFKIDKINILTKGGEQVNKISHTSRNIVLAFKNIKKITRKINIKFFNTVLYASTNRIFDINSSYFINLVNMYKEIQKDNHGSDADDFETKYINKVDLSNKWCVVITSSIEKYEKENTGNKGGNDNEDNYMYENNLPKEDWNEITGQLKTELESVAKIQEDLEAAHQKLKDSKLEKAELEAKYEDLNRSKSANDMKWGELVIKVGKIAQWESANEDYAKRIEKYKIAVEGLQKTADKYMADAKDYKLKYEHMKDRKDKPDARKSGRNIMMPTASGMPNMDAGNYAPIIHTVCTLQKERKFLKSKLMKEKLMNLIEDNSSYMNKFINKDWKISKHDNEKDNYRNIEDNVKDLNSNYAKIRQKLCLPTVYDISSKDYNYEKSTILNNQALNQWKIDYVKDADSILYNMFGDRTLDRTFKEIIDNDISRTLDYYGENKLIVGRIKFKKEEKEKEKNDVPSGNVTTIPVIMSEQSLKLLNKTFIH